MTNIEKLDNKLYISKYGIPKVGDPILIWEQIKVEPKILCDAVCVKRDKWNSGDTVCGPTISENILIDYKSVDMVAYNSLIQSIYSNRDIARIVVDGASNGGYSFLLMSLWNHNLKLSDEQKAFAVDEAMNKLGTVRDHSNKGSFSRVLDQKGITDDEIVFIENGGSINPIGKKTANEYLNDMFTGMSTSQAHGVGAYDIRYQILRNPNWSLEEKKRLINDFWCDDEEFDEVLDQWVLDISGDIASHSDEEETYFDSWDLVNDCTYEELFTFVKDKHVADKIWEEMNFCKQMAALRPPKWLQEPSKNFEVLPK